LIPLEGRFLRKKRRSLPQPMLWRRLGKIKKGEEEIFFLSKDEKSYSVRIGEVIEGYKKP